MTHILQIIKEQQAKLFAIGPGILAALVAIAVSPGPGPVVPLLAFFSVAAFAGTAILWLRDDAALRAAEHTAAHATSQYVLLANRLIRLEQQMKMPADANPALRNTVAEVTGTVGLLGGVVRELARNVAAQNRDVADLKDTLKAGPKPEAEPHQPTLKIVPEPRPVPPQPDHGQGEPSLLPAARRSSEDELRRMRLVVQAFEADRIELHLQPIVVLPQRKIRLYEALARLRLADGTLLGPSEFLSSLERLGRAPEFDRRVIVRAITVARHLAARGSEAIVGVNLSPQTIREPGFLWTLVGLFDTAPEALGKVVLEFSQACWRGLDPDQKEALATLRDRGVPLSLDRAADLRFEAAELGRCGVRFLKLPADLMVAAAEADDGREIGDELGVRDFASALRREGIRLVAEYVEHEDMVPALVDLGVPLAQGFVFAAPRAVKAEVFEASAPPYGGKAQPELLRSAG